MKTIKKMTLVISIVFLGFLMVACSKDEEISNVEEVDLSHELKIIEAFGLIKAEESKDIIIDFPAVVQEVLVKDGQHIGFHTPILTLDLSEYQSQITDKKNDLNIAKLEHQRLNKGLQGLTLENREPEIDKLINDLDFSKKLYGQALEDLHSKEKLYEAGAISQESLDQFKRSVDEAKKNVDSSEYELQLSASRHDRELEQFRLKQDTESDQVGIQRERIRQIENNLSALNDRLNKSYMIGNQIVSEFESAAVHDITYASGHMTDTERKAFSIINLENLIVEANVVEEFIRDVHQGASVRIVPIADRTREYEGTVFYISQMAFPSNGETVIPVRISIDNLDSFLLPNYNVDVYIKVK
ncbi:HlyD family secretion protein [Alkaliphilus metalliredigens]|uniref:HlyD family secretion protein n=1 Tax=Alkaliphilus metalliredigens TaxID=208226 RepID=UPI001F604873|nr:efflux RND transporter periplasmic adaptor subunit [Alkaliphilus metalliredigens]